MSYLDDILENIPKLLARPLLKIAGTEVTLISILIFLLAVSVSFTFSYILQRGLKKTLAHRFEKQEGTLAAILRLIHYTVVIIGFGIGLQTIGINISALFAAGAVFAIAIGFAMQNIVQNFVSGIILLIERTIKPGDILEIEGTVVRVIDMGIRTTVVRTLLEEEIIMPNSVFAQSSVKNYTLNDDAYRLGIKVGVSYESDMRQVFEVLETVASKVPWRQPEAKPAILLQDFGDSAVLFVVYVTIDDPWRQRMYMSELRKAVWFALKEAGITIAFNQMDIHLDPPVTEAFTKLTKIK